MKRIIIALILLVSIPLSAQTDKDDSTPEETVEKFFAAFHAQDTVKLKNFAVEGTKLQSVSKDEEGNTKLSTDDYSNFLKSIASIPAEVSFKEKIHEYRVEENGLLATVTTPYSFYYNGNLSHCGVNSFQLVKFKDDWKIVYLIDTRIKECE